MNGQENSLLVGNISSQITTSLELPEKITTTINREVQIPESSRNEQLIALPRSNLMKTRELLDEICSSKSSSFEFALSLASLFAGGWFGNLMQTGIAFDSSNIKTTLSSIVTLLLAMVCAFWAIYVSKFEKLDSIRNSKEILRLLFDRTIEGDGE
ncbi:MAG: hypothetical protein PHP02_00515 [Eubacteriales bacterium]|nr:hypothetical protein [Eubacteriales bacterium]